MFRLEIEKEHFLMVAPALFEAATYVPLPSFGAFPPPSQIS